MNLLKVKIRKEHKNIFCVPSQIFKNISWLINICLKYFMTLEKTLRPPPFLNNEIKIHNAYLYSRRNNRVIQSIPHSVKGKDLEEKVINLLDKVNVKVTENDNSEVRQSKTFV